ncbi:MAG: 2'-5' RNA ligase family protein [Imperialibacter sp.]|uniref:2'-5' RNA ligase family protein n=1 Tax=Imperialibacter sp. TaxID=2038411 RepID=UPI0032EFAA96
MSESSSLFPAQRSQQVFEYLFLIHLKEIEKDVVALKDRVFNAIGSRYAGHHSTPHISLFNISSTDQMDHMLELMNISWMPSFQVDVNGFDYYSHGQKSRTLYVNIERKDSIVYLQKWLANFFRLRKHSYDPHITLGRTIPIDLFEKAWDDIKTLRFQKSFTCDRLVVLKRKQQKEEPLKWGPYREIILASN